MLQLPHSCIEKKKNKKVIKTVNVQRISKKTRKTIYCIDICIRIPVMNSVQGKNSPCEDILGNVEDLIAGLAGFVSAVYVCRLSGENGGPQGHAAHQYICI